MIQTIKYLLILTIIFSYQQGISQTYEDVVEKGKRKLNKSKYLEALAIFEEGLNLKEVKRDDVKRSDIYFYIALSKYIMNDKDYNKDLNNSLICNNVNGNACLLKSLYFYDKGNIGQMKQYLRCASEQENLTEIFF